MNLRWILFYLAVLSCTQAIYAQQSQRNKALKGTTFIRFNALGLADLVEPNLSFGGEYHLQPLWSVSLDAAWVFHSKYYQNIHHTNGIILRPALRKYNKRNERIYYELELHYKYVYYQMLDWIGKDCVEGVPAYEQYTKFGVTRKVLGVHLKTGAEYPLTKDSRLWLEIYGGLGVRMIRKGLYRQPNSCYELTGFFPTEVTQLTKVMPAIPMGLRLLYRVK